MVVLREELNEVMEILGKSKNPLLTQFYAKVSSFVFTGKHGNSRSTMVYINKEDAKVSKFDHPIKVTTYLTVSKDKKINCGEEVVSEIVFDILEEGSSKRKLDSALRVKNMGGTKVCSLVCNNGEKSQRYCFEIKSNKVTKFEEVSEVKPVAEKVK